MTALSRRTALFSAAAFGAGVLAGCAGANRTPDEGDEGRGGDPAAARDRYGVGTYNTQQVGDELAFVEQNVEPPTEGSARRVLITGSTAGIGQLAAAHLLARGHSVVAHARNETRAADVRRDLPGLEHVVVGDLLHLDQTRALATQVNALGAFDVIIHNAGEYGLSNEEILNANSLSPYLLTCLVDAPRQATVYLTSDLHLGGDLKLGEIRSGGTDITYDDSKLHMATLAMAVARRHPAIQVNAVAPGWVPTLMGFHNGPYAPDDLREGYMTQVWLAEGIEPSSRVTGEFLFHQERESRLHPSVHDLRAQDDLLNAYAERTGVSLT